MLSAAIAIAQALALLVIMTAQALAIAEQRRKMAIERQSKDESRFPFQITNTRMFSAPVDKEIDVKIAQKPTIEKQPENCDQARKPYAIVATGEPDTTEEISAIPDKLRKILAAKSITQAQWCQQHQINQKQLSLAKSHLRLAKAGKETAPGAKIRKIMTILQSEIQQIEKEPS
jgi:hypothetical protein